MDTRQPNGSGENAPTYASPPGTVTTEDELAAWLRDIIKKAPLKIHIPECLLCTVLDAERELFQAGYSIQVVPIEGSNASASFWLKKVR